MRLRAATCSRLIRAGRMACTSPMAGPYRRATVPPARPGKVGAVGVALLDVPGQRAEALPETGGPPGPATHAAAGADGLTVASLEIRAPHAPAGHRARPRSAHHMPPSGQ